MRAVRALAQAKINVFLRVFGRDASGYHDIATLFQRVDLADELLIRVGGSIRSLDVNGPQVPAAGLGSPESNLAYRAAIAYADRTGGKFPRGFAIELTKNIPVGGGLGGGSADAGAVLRGLDALAPAPLGRAKLEEIAAALGSDVPFLASDHVTALAHGRGERLEPVPAPPPADLLLIIPAFSIATADAYRWLDENRGSQRSGAPVGLPHPDTRSWRALAEVSGNDFETVLEMRHPELRVYRERLARLGATIARVTGSGSCVFGLFEDAVHESPAIVPEAASVLTRTSSRVVQVEVLE